MRPQKIYTNETFRLRRSIQIQGIVFTLFFLAVAIASATSMFLGQPEKHGFKGENSAAIMAGVFLVFWGGWALLGAYTLVSYYVEGVTVAGTFVTVRSVFQNRQFDTSAVVKLTWKARLAGRLVFSTSDHRTKLDLYGFSDQDRLRLIRLFRGLIAEDQQFEWPMFCHKVASHFETDD